MPTASWTSSTRTSHHYRCVPEAPPSVHCVWDGALGSPPSFHCPRLAPVETPTVAMESCGHRSPQRHHWWRPHPASSAPRMAPWNLPSIYGALENVCGSPARSTEFWTVPPWPGPASMASQSAPEATPPHYEVLGRDSSIQCILDGACGIPAPSLGCPGGRLLMPCPACEASWVAPAASGPRTTPLEEASPSVSGVLDSAC